MAEDLQVRRAGEFPEATLRRPANVVGMTVLLAILGVVLGGAAIVMPWVGKLAVLGLATPLFLMAAWVARKAPEGGTGLQVDLSGISVGGRLQLSRSLLNRATVVEEGGKTVVVLQSKLFVCLVDVRDGEEGRALIRALGMDPTGAISDFAFDSPLASHFPPWLFWLYLFVPLLIFAPLVLGMEWLAPLLLVLWYVGLMAMALPEKLSVGLDGVMLRWLWRRRVIPFEALQEVSSDDRAIRLRRRNGEEVKLSAYWTAQPWEHGWYKDSTGFGSRRAYLDAILARIEEARGARKEAGGASAAAWLARRGQGLPDWLGKLRGLVASAQGGFRQETLEPEQLWSTLEDAQQPALVRAAAAAALAPSLDAGGRERLRVASSVVVDPGLRTALDASLQEDEEALLRAFTSLEQQQQQPRRSG
jgi:hypothetical protein